MRLLRLKDPESARLLLKTLELIGRRLDSQKSSLDAEVLRLSAYQQGVLLRAMDAISTGSMVHQANWIDVSMKMD